MTQPSRQELERMIDRYLEAVVADDPSRLPWADEFEYVENNQRIEPGEGVWATIDGIGTYHHYYSDPERGRAGHIGTARENGVPCLLNFFLELVDGKITRAESLIIRDAVGARNLDRQGEPHDIHVSAAGPLRRECDSGVGLGRGNEFGGELLERLDDVAEVGAGSRSLQLIDADVQHEAAGLGARGHGPQARSVRGGRIRGRGLGGRLRRSEVTGE